MLKNMTSTTFLTAVGDRIDAVSKQYDFRFNYPSMPLYVSAADRNIIGINNTPSANGTFSLCFPIRQPITDAHVRATIRGAKQPPWYFQLRQVWITGPLHKFTQAQAAELVLEHVYLEDPAYRMWIHIPIEIVEDNNVGGALTYSNSSLTSLVTWGATWATRSSLQQAQSLTDYRGFVDAQSWVSTAAASDEEQNAYCYTIGAVGKTEYVVLMKSTLTLKASEFLSPTVCGQLTVDRLTARSFGNVYATPESVLPGDLVSSSSNSYRGGPPHTILRDGRPERGYTYKPLSNSRSTLGHFTTALTLMLVVLFWIVILLGAAHVDSVHDWLFKDRGKVFWYLLLAFSLVGLTTTLTGMALDVPMMLGVGVGTLVATALFWLLFKVSIRDRHTVTMNFREFLAYSWNTRLGWKVVTAETYNANESSSGMMSAVLGQTRTYSLVKAWVGYPHLAIDQFYPFGREHNVDLVNLHDDFTEPWIERWFDPAERRAVEYSNQAFRGRMVGFTLRSDTLRQADAEMRRRPNSRQPPAAPPQPSLLQSLNPLAAKVPDHKLALYAWRRDHVQTYLVRHHRLLRTMRPAGSEWTYTHNPTSGLVSAYSLGWQMTHLDTTFFHRMKLPAPNLEVVNDLYIQTPILSEAQTVPPTLVWQPSLPVPPKAAIYAVALQEAITELVPEYEFLNRKIVVHPTTVPLRQPISNMVETNTKIKNIIDLVNKIIDTDEIYKAFKFVDTDSDVDRVRDILRVICMLIMWVEPSSIHNTFPEHLNMKSFLEQFGPTGKDTKHSIANIIAFRVTIPYGKFVNDNGDATIPEYQGGKLTSDAYSYLHFIYKLVVTGSPPFTAATLPPPASATG